MSTKVFVGNLNFSTTRDELAQVLAEAGTVVDVHLPTDRETGRPRGFAFVQFSSEAEAAEAIKLFNGREVGGRKLNMNPADDRPRRTEGARPPRSFGPSQSFSPPPATFGSDFGTDAFGRDKRPFKTKGSRRGLRGRKRSLSY